MRWRPGSASLSSPALQLDRQLELDAFRFTDLSQLPLLDLRETLIGSISAHQLIDGVEALGGPGEARAIRRYLHLVEREIELLRHQRRQLDRHAEGRLLRHR